MKDSFGTATQSPNSKGVKDSVNNEDFTLDEEKEGLEQVENLNLELPDYVPDSDEEKKLVRKIDRLLLPTVFIMYFLSYMDRIK